MTFQILFIALVINNNLISDKINPLIQNYLDVRPRSCAAEVRPPDETSFLEGFGFSQLTATEFKGPEKSCEEIQNTEYRVPIDIILTELKRVLTKALQNLIASLIRLLSRIKSIRVRVIVKVETKN